MKPSRLWLYSLVARLLPETRCFAFKCFFLRWCGLRIGRDVRIASSVKIIGCGEIEIGNDVWIGPNSFLFASANSVIRISDCVDIAPFVRILTGSHHVDVHGEHMAGQGYRRDVIVGTGCWIGAGSTVLPGVQLADKTVVGAGSVVTKSVDESYVLVAGVPAVLKKRYNA